MVQIVASLLFAIACGYALIVLVGMVRSNAAAILSALGGYGAFPDANGPINGPVLYQPVITLRRTLRPARRACMVAPPSLADIRRAAA